MKLLTASLAMNGALAVAVLVLLIRMAPSPAERYGAEAAAVLDAAARDAAPHLDPARAPNGAPTDGAPGSCEAELARCRGDELSRCVATVRELGRKVAEHDQRDLGKLFEGGEPNAVLVERLRGFFAQGTDLECHDVVCQIREHGTDDELGRRSEERMRDPYFHALAEAQSMGPGDNGERRHLVKVTGEALDGERVLGFWLAMTAPEVIRFCSADKVADIIVAARIDERGAIALESVKGGDAAQCVRGLLTAAVPPQKPMATRPARLEQPLLHPGVPP